MKHSLFLLLATVAFSIPMALAAPVNYSTGFSTGDSPAFVDGGLNEQNTWVAHVACSVSDAAGASLVNHVNANGPVHLGSSADVKSELAAGQTITLTLRFKFEGDFSDQNSGAWLLGLSNNAGGMPEGASATIGCATFQDLSNSNFWLSPVGFPNESKFDTGKLMDDEFHTLTTTITRSVAENEFNITANLDGLETSYIMTHEGLWTGDDDAYAGFRFRGNQAGFIDAFSVSSTGDGGVGDEVIVIDDSSFEAGTGFTINYTSTVGPVDVYRNATGDLTPGKFSLIASGESGGTFVDPDEDAELDPKAFYILVSEGDLPFAP